MAATLQAFQAEYCLTCAACLRCMVTGSPVHSAGTTTTRGFCSWHHLVTLISLLPVPFPAMLGLPCEAEKCTMIYVVLTNCFYIALFWALEQTYCALVARDFKWVNVTFSEYPPKWCTYSTVLVVTWLVPRETAAIAACSVYTIQPCTMSGHFMQSHTHTSNIGCFTQVGHGHVL